MPTLKATWHLACVAALLAVALDGLLLYASVPFAHADGLAYLPMALALFAPTTLLCAWPLQLALRRPALLQLRFGPWLLAAVGTLSSALWLLRMRETLLSRLKPEFPALLSQLNAAITLCLLAASLAVGGGLYRLTRDRQRWARPIGALRISLAALTAYALYLAHVVAEPLHLRLLAGPLLITALVSAWLLVRSLDAGAAPGTPEGAGSRSQLRSIGRVLGFLVLLLGVLLPLRTWPWGNAASRFLLFNHSPTAGSLAAALRALSDFDGDGSAPRWLLGGDCAPFDPEIAPLRAELPGNGIDDDCRGGDAQTLPPPAAPAQVDVQCTARDTPLSLIVITVDAMRASALHPQVTPALWKLASSSLWFSRAYAGGGYTYHSTFVLSTGLRVSDLRADLSGQPAPSGAHIAGTLKRQGYATAAFWPVRMPSGLLKGWDLHWSNIGEQQSNIIPHTAAALTDAATRWIDARATAATTDGARTPYFAWLHYTDAHAPYEDTPPVSPRSASLPNYLRELEYVDFHVSRLLQALQSRGALERTAILFTADHGEDLGIHGHEGHGADAYDDTAHVPLSLYVPGCEAQRIERPVSHVRVAATLRALAGLPNAGRSLLDGHDPRPVVTEAFSDELLGDEHRYKRALIAGDKKLIVDVRNDAYALFDLSRDPDETSNLFDRDETARAQLLELYQRWLDQRW